MDFTKVGTDFNSSYNEFLTIYRTSSQTFKKFKTLKPSREIFLNSVKHHSELNDRLLKSVNILHSVEDNFFDVQIPEFELDLQPIGPPHLNHKALVIANEAAHYQPKFTLINSYVNKINNLRWMLRDIHDNQFTHIVAGTCASKHFTEVLRNPRPSNELRKAVVVYGRVIWEMEHSLNKFDAKLNEFINTTQYIGAADAA